MTISLLQEKLTLVLLKKGFFENKELIFLEFFQPFGYIEALNLILLRRIQVVESLSSI